MKYTHRHSYANFGTFFLGHPVYIYDKIVVSVPHFTCDSLNSQITIRAQNKNMIYHLYCTTNKKPKIWTSEVFGFSFKT